MRLSPVLRRRVTGRLSIGSSNSVLAFAIFAVALRVRELVFFNGLTGAAELLLAMTDSLSFNIEI
ncbi:MAG: hypothetical protein WA744_02635 [Candidatus Acidiferrales bacterium]